jgi:hypothetical protein
MSEEIIWTEDSNENADWIKSGSWDLPTNAEEFLRSLGDMTLGNFMKLPAAQAMPDDLREELLSLGHSEAEKKQ